MFLILFSWISILGFATFGLFPQFKIFHIFLGILTLFATALLNFFISEVAVEKYGIDYIQPEKRGKNKLNKDLYKIYVPVAIFQTIAFTSWPWAVVPTLSTVSWSLNSIGFLNTFGSYILSLIVYDFIYYLGHYLMHKDKIYYKYIHKIHHQLTAPGNLFDNLYIHPVELFIFLWLQVLPLYIVPMHIITVFIYFFTIFAVTSMYHVGIQFPSFLPLLSPKFHDDHHRLNNVNFSFFTELPDYLFGTNK